MKIAKTKLEDLVTSFGFSKYKENRDLFNYYYAFGKDGLILIVNSQDCELKLEKLVTDGSDVRIHKKINLHSKSTETPVDIIYKLTVLGMFKEDDSDEDLIEGLRGVEEEIL